MTRYALLLPKSFCLLLSRLPTILFSLCQRKMREKCSLILLRDILVEVTFEKADRTDKTLEVSGKVRQVDGTQAEVRRFEVTAYSFSLSLIAQ